MPEYRLVFSNGKRSVRHVDVEAADLASAAAAFAPPEGWMLHSARLRLDMEKRSHLGSMPMWLVMTVRAAIAATTGAAMVVSLRRSSDPPLRTPDGSPDFILLVGLLSPAIVAVIWTLLAQRRDLRNIAGRTSSCAPWPVRGRSGSGWATLAGLCLSAFAVAFGMRFVVSAPPEATQGFVAGVLLFGSLLFFVGMNEGSPGAPREIAAEAPPARA